MGRPSVSRRRQAGVGGRRLSGQAGCPFFCKVPASSSVLAAASVIAAYLPAERGLSSTIVNLICIKAAWELLCTVTYVLKRSLPPRTSLLRSPWWLVSTVRRCSLRP